jgi:alpha-1,2-mannosyltransferase
VTRLALRVGLVAGLCVLAWFVALHTVRSSLHGFFDLTVYRGAVGAWLDGGSLYAYHVPDLRFGFTYPPFAALAMVPAVVVGLLPAEVLSTAATCLLVVAALWWWLAPVARRAGWSPPFAVALTVPVVFLMEPVRETVGFGQVNVFLAALVLADVVAARSGRGWAGVGIGLATAVKLTPGVFVLYLLATRRWRAAATAVGTFAAASALDLAVDPHTSVFFWTTELWDTRRVGRLFGTNTQSLLGVLARIALPGPPNRVLWLVLALAVLALALWRAVRADRAGDDLAAVTLIGLAGCLVSPISWTHHLIWVVPAAVVVLDRAVALPRSARSLAAAAGCAVVVGVFCSSLPWFFQDWHTSGHPGGVAGAVLENAYAGLVLALVVFLPVRLTGQAQADVRRSGEQSQRREVDPCEPAAGSSWRPQSSSG